METECIIMALVYVERLTRVFAHHRLLLAYRHSQLVLCRRMHVGSLSVGYEGRRADPSKQLEIRVAVLHDHGLESLGRP